MPDERPIHYSTVNRQTKRIGFEIFKDVLRAREFGARDSGGYSVYFIFEVRQVHKSVTLFRPIPSPTHLPVADYKKHLDWRDFLEYQY